MGDLIKILIVDDLKSMREEFVSICRSFLPAARIDEASDVMMALGFIQKEAPPYDVVFTDINMPEINGLKLILHLRKLAAYRDTPVIVISTVAAHSDVERAMQIGANGYLNRPLQKEDFEVILLTYLRPILLKRRSSTSLETEKLMKSLRKIVK